MFYIRGKQEKITNAELRLYKRRTKTKNRPQWCSIALFLHQKGIKGKGNYSRTVGPTFVEIKVVAFSGKSRWLEFNVSKVIREQFEKYRNKVVQFRVYIAAYGGGTPRKSSISRHGRHRPNLVVYSRFKEQKRKTLSLDLTAMADAMISIKSRSKRGNKNEYCKRRSLYVKFGSLNLDWIVAPAGFSAYICEGACPEVLTSYFNPNNHAILQNLLHYRYSKLIPQASCVPTSLNAVTILYTVGESFVLREFPDMVASNCGCR